MIMSMPLASVFVWRVFRSLANRSMSGFLQGSARRASSGRRQTPNHRGVREVPERLDVTSPFRRVGRALGNCLVHEAVPDRVHHRLVLCHCVYYAFRGVGFPEGQWLGTGQLRDISHLGSAKALQRIGA